MGMTIRKDFAFNDHDDEGMSCIMCERPLI
jgi:hypothetical protein